MSTMMREEIRSEDDQVVVWEEEERSGLEKLLSESLSVYLGLSSTNPTGPRPPPISSVLVGVTRKKTSASGLSKVYKSGGPEMGDLWGWIDMVTDSWLEMVNGFRSEKKIQYILLIP
ncbi:hypothetical protein L6452_37782 [Arctium lappa]|uniref:Uncharacterized protein n=1 Tax=Arctium lappa TaxID=4217 RepID=A0ACB8Y4M7_ARCLA|nr:hypothetical protein L6452_37782 [Arctium lappa]